MGVESSPFDLIGECLNNRTCRTCWIAFGAARLDFEARCLRRFGGRFRTAGSCRFLAHGDSKQP